MQHIIVLSDEVDQQANMLAERFGISLEELMNRAIAHFVEQENKKLASLTIDKYDDEETDFDLFERPADLHWTDRLEFE